MAYDKNFMNAIFSDREYIAKMTTEEKRQNFFTMCRNISKQYPTDVQMFNITKINQADVVDVFADKLYTGGRPPKWIYTKSSGMEKGAKGSDSINKKLLNEYCKWKHMSVKDVENAFILFPDDFKKDLAEFEKYLKDIKSED